MALGSALAMFLHVPGLAWPSHQLSGGQSASLGRDARPTCVSSSMTCQDFGTRAWTRPSFWAAVKSRRRRCAPLEVTTTHHSPGRRGRQPTRSPTPPGRLPLPVPTATAERVERSANFGNVQPPAQRGRGINRPPKFKRESARRSAGPGPCRHRSVLGCARDRRSAHCEAIFGQ